ncbi:MAG: polyhydroxyalkanoic acid system family protein [Myxococcales bacterium]|jgi:putative polyhydroxyalkanoate system protein|nr:polyhydroxyalkanoic acid system family protein [Myxococcales bacterium]
MATIDITQSHRLTLDDAKAKAEELAKSMETKFGLSWKWAGNTINFEAPSGAAKGTKGEVAVTDKDVRVAIDLPFMLKMMKGTIEEKIKERLAQFA